MLKSISACTLPNYTRGEELFNMISHIIGGSIGFVALLTCSISAAYHQNIWGIACGLVYGLSLVLLYTMSSIYHGLPAGTPKKVFRVIDHCTIFILIAGTYTPVMLGGRFREVYPLAAWGIFGVVWGLALLGIALNTIDMKRFRHISLACYLGMGWCIIVKIGAVIEVFGWAFFACLLAGGIFYTIGAALYVIGKKKKYIHSVFHIFTDLATLCHFIGIAVWVMPG